MTQLLRATASGEQHGLINTLTNSVEFNDFKYMKPEVKARLEKQKKEDDKIVKVEYLNSRGRHERLTKPYCKYAGDPIKVWHMIPGQIYEVPKGFVDEVNEVESRRMQRSGLLEVDGKNATESGAPLDKDTKSEWVHKLVPAGF